MLKAILFDLDGTLLDRDTSLISFIDYQYDRLHNFLGHINKKQYIDRFIELDNRGYTWKDVVYETLVNEFQIDCVSPKELLQDYLEYFPHHCIAFPHVIEMLEALKARQVKLGMITNGFEKFQMDNIVALNIQQYFDVILISESEGIKKPNPEIFTRALSQLDVEASDSVFIGDHPENDISAARAVGMKTIWKRDPHWLLSVDTDAIVEDYAKFESVLQMIELNTLKEKFAAIQQTIYMDQNDYLREKTSNKQALKEVITEGESLLTADSKNAQFICGLIGNLYRICEEPEQAIQYLEKSLQAAETAGEIKKVMVAQIRLGEAYKYANAHQKAMAYFDSALAKCEQNRIDSYLDFVLQHRGKCLLELGNADEAKKCLQEALVIRELKGDASLIESTKLALNLI